MPTRIQRTRIKGQPGMPPGAVYVGRPTRFGSGFAIAPAASQRGGPLDMWAVHYQGLILGRWDDKDAARAEATDRYARWINEPAQTETRRLFRALLFGRDLACWCPLPAPGQPDHCHAAVLLRLANGDGA